MSTTNCNNFRLPVEIDPVYYYFVKGTPTAVRALVRRALAAVAQETAVTATYRTRNGIEEESRNYTPPYLFACCEIDDYTVITLGGTNWKGGFALNTEGIEGIEEFIWIHRFFSISEMEHNDTEGKILSRAEDFGLEFLL